MINKMLTILLSLALDLLAIIKVTEGDKDLEIIVLRQQVRILQRKVIIFHLKMSHLEGNCQ